MRDAQSLLEQLLSFGGERLTVELVQQQLGIASDDRTLDLLEALSRRDAAEALRIVEQTSSAGVQPTELLAGAMEFLRDAMTIAVKADVSPSLATPRQKPRLKAIAESWSLDTLLAALQILTEARGRLRGSPHGRILVEIAVMKVALLDDLGDLGEVVARLAALESGAPPVAPLEKKKLTPVEPAAVVRPPPEPAESRAEAAPTVPPRRCPRPSRRPANAGPGTSKPIAAAWPGWVVEPAARDRLEADPPRPRPRPGRTSSSSSRRPDTIGSSTPASGPTSGSRSSPPSASWLDRPVEIRFARPVEAKPPTAAPTRHPGAIARDDGIGDDPLVKLVVERFEARAVRVDVEDDSPG